MVLFHWKKDQFFKYLESKGCTRITTDFTDAIVFIGPKNREVVPIKIERSYYHPIIIRTCEDLGIEAPVEFLAIKEEFNNLRRACEKKSPLLKINPGKQGLN